VLEEECDPEGMKMESRRYENKIERAVSVIAVVWGQATPLVWRHGSPVSHVIISVKGVYSSYKMLRRGKM
jgi:hypothetical protein